MMTRTGPTVSLKVVKQGALYHGLAMLLDQSSPANNRGEERGADLGEIENNGRRNCFDQIERPDGRSDTEIKSRLAMATAALAKLQPLLNNNHYNKDKNKTSKSHRHIHRPIWL